MAIDWSWYVPRSLVGKAVLRGVLTANLAAPLAAAVVASVYRFPLPLIGYGYGISNAVNAAFASLFYLIFGGALVLAALGAVGGLVAVRIAAPDAGRVARLTTAMAIVVALLGATVLATAELIVDGR
ncbi:hypothetical protein AB0N05_06305 [Nocardia sp. NPDC051030]|uniref:hypothetical protein n=1 Tax=Nocardia sp. NPDC051030 TaxID=3155162 RepID=UPI003434617B